MSDKLLKELASFARETQLRGKWAIGAKKITPLQRTWTRYMLMNWGSKHRGSEGPERGAMNILGRLMWNQEWNGDQGDRIQVIFSNLAQQGYSGDELLKKVKEIFLPQNSGASAITLAKESDDAAFVESVMHKVIKRDSPMRSVAIKRYCDRKCPQDIARDINYHTGCDVQAARKRVIWCEEILEEEMFYGIKRSMEEEITQKAA